MRRTLAALVMTAWPALASAQATLAPVPSLPPIGLPLPTITAPLTPIGLSSMSIPTPKDTDRQRPRQRFDARRGHRPQWPLVYLVPVYWPVAIGAAKPGGIIAADPSAASPEDRADTVSTSIADRPIGDSVSATVQTADVPAALSSTVPAPPSTFYFIPGCYMGNVPPANVVLPATCDRSRLITRTP